MAIASPKFWFYNNMHMNLLNKFKVLLLDMNSTFMFGGDRFSENEDAVPFKILPFLFFISFSFTW